jgi:flagellar protein FliO/FliZ
LRWLQSVFGSDGSPIVQYIVIFAVIFTALAAIVFTVRRLTGRTIALPGRAGSRGRQPRLGIVDVYELDRARQLILLRRDNVEHLLLVGGPNDVVVERNIQRTQRPLPEAAIRPELAQEALDEPLPDPMVQGGRLPEPPRALPEMTGRRAEPLFEPGFEMPVVVAPPVPRSAAAPPVTLPLDTALLGGDEPGQDIAEAARAPEAPTAEPATVPAPAPRESGPPRRVLSRTAPPLVEPRPGPASERRPEPAAANETFRAAPSLAVPADRRSVDPAVLSDMARQLQAALSRPASAVTPAPAAPPSADAESRVTADVDPMAAAMAAAPQVPSEVTPQVPFGGPAQVPPQVPPQVVPQAPPQASPPVPAPAPPPEAPPPAVPPRPAVTDIVTPASPPASPPQPAALAPVRDIPTMPDPPAPAPEPALPKAGPTLAAEPPAPQPEAKDTKAAGNPFSVEEIEAEFARLLGRPLDKRT